MWVKVHVSTETDWVTGRTVLIDLSQKELDENHQKDDFLQTFGKSIMFIRKKKKISTSIFYKPDLDI